MGREIVKDYSQHACANQSSRLEEVHSCRTCAVWVHTDRSLKGLIGETAAHVSCLRAGDVSHCVYVESHHGCCWNGTRRGRKGSATRWPCCSRSNGTNPLGWSC